VDEDAVEGKAQARAPARAMRAEHSGANSGRAKVKALGQAGATRQRRN
jgi:hypothetical protein